MIVSGGTTIRQALRYDWKPLLFLALLSVLSELIYLHYPLRHTALPSLPVGMFITAMSIFLGFQVNQCYDRWWEARRLWGQLVNTSRSFGRQVSSLLTHDRIARLGDDAVAANVQRELIYRQIAYANALRTALRKGGKLEEGDFVALEHLLSIQELKECRRAANPCTQLIQRQGRRLAELCGSSVEEQQVLLQLDETLNQFYDIQGGCERIKRSSFPERFSFHTRAFVWLLAMLIPFSLIDTEQGFDLAALITETLLAFVFVTIERLGRELRDPFENRVNDVPMSALCRSIEIDLRQQLGESDLPPPLLPINGVLM